MLPCRLRDIIVGMATPLREFFCLREGAKEDADEFLRSHGFTTSGRQMSGRHDAQTNAARPKPGDKGRADQLVPKEVQPPYPGTFVGQAVKAGQHYVPRNVSFLDKDTQERKYGKVQSAVQSYFTWDGKAWQFPEYFKKHGPAK